MYKGSCIFETDVPSSPMMDILDNSIEISYNNMTCVGLWHKPKSSAPYVCIEPWHGIPSTKGIIDDFKTKQQMIKLGTNEEYNNFYVIKIIEDYL